MPKKIISMSKEEGFSSLLVLAIIVIVLILAGIFIYNNQNQTNQAIAQGPSPTTFIKPSITPTPTLDISDTSLDRDEDAIDGKLSDLDTDANNIDLPPVPANGSVTPKDSTVDKPTQELDKRLEALTALKDRVDEARKLSAEQKVTLSKMLSDEITTVTQVKKKLAAQTDPKQLKIEQQAVLADTTVLGFIVPKVNTILNGDLVLETSDRIIEYNQKLNLKLAVAKAAGNTVTALATRLTNILTSLEEIQTDTQKSIELTSGLLPTGYPSNKANLTEIRVSLRTERTGLKEAWKSAKTARTGFKNFKVKASPTP